MRNIKMVLFDYGNTLIYEEIVEGPKALEKIYNLINKKEITLEEFFEEFSKEKSKYLKTHHPQNIDFHYSEVFENTFEKLGFKTEDDFEEISKIYFDEYAKGFPIEGAVELLEYLEENNISYGVISNLSWSGEILKNRIEEILGKKIDLVLTSADTKYRKPHENIFKIAEEKTGINLENMIYVGDNPLCDVKGSFDCNMTPIHYNGKTTSPFVLESDKIELDFDHYKIKNLIEIIKILEGE